MLAIGAGAGRDSYPERDGIGGIGRDGSDSGEHERGEGDEAAASSDGVERSAESTGEEQEDYGVQAQVQDVSRVGREEREDGKKIEKSVTKVTSFR